jgi:hypothetical protein
MAIDTDQFADDFDGIINDLPDTLTIAGITASVVFTDYQRSKQLEEGGFEPTYDASAHAKYSDINSVASVGITCSVRSTTFRVDGISRSPDLVELRLDLTATTRK